MYTLIHSLILILILIVLVSSPSDKLRSCLVSVEARRLTNSNYNVLTMDLIHRDSLLLPQERQKRRPWGLVSPRHRIHLSSSEFSKKTGSNTVDAEIAPDDVGSEYLIKLAIGTPPEEFMAVADTGSDLIWLQCSACQTTQTCISQQSLLFDTTRSSTYQPISCSSPSCNYTGFFIGGFSSGCSSGATSTDQNSPCQYFQSYADSTNTTGILSTETITIPSADAAPSVSLPSTVFGCGLIQNGNVSNVGSIVGLGTGPLSLVSQLGQSKFSYCLVPRSSGTTSKLKFGADVTSPGVVSTPFATKDSDHYHITLDGISIGDNLFSVGLDVIIDSGTTLTVLETSVYNSIKDAIKSTIALDPLSGPDIGSFLCYETQESLNAPNVVFHFKEADVVLNTINIFWDPTQGVKCLAMAPTNDTTFLFGNIAQINLEVGYDLQAQQILFAPADCTSF